MTVAVMTVTVLMMVMMNMMMMTMLVVVMMTATWVTPWQNKTKASISCLQTFREDTEVENKNFSHLIVLRSQLSFLPGVWNWSGPVRCRGSTFMPAPGLGQCSLCSLCATSKPWFAWQRNSGHKSWAPELSEFSLHQGHWDETRQVQCCTHLTLYHTNQPKLYERGPIKEMFN